MTEKEFIDQCVEAINTPEAAKRREEADRRFIQSVSDEIYNPYPNDIEDGEDEIDSNAYRGHTDLTSINIPDTIKYIGWNAFEGCTIQSITC